MDCHYEALVCYDRRDTSWIRDVLLLHLEHFGVSYSVDFNDFVPGKSIISELFRLHHASRNTILVISPHWRSSPQATFAFQLVQHYGPEELEDRILILRLGGCEIPAMLFRVPMIDANGESSKVMLEVHKWLFRKSPPLGTYSISAEAALASFDSPTGQTGKSYVADLRIANPDAHAVIYDTIILTFDTTGQISLNPPTARSIMVGSINGQFHLAPTFYDDPFTARRRVRELQRNTAWDGYTLEGFSAVILENIPLLNAPVSIGQSVTTLSLCLAIGDTPVTETCLSPLPSVLLVPDASGSARHKVALIGLEYLPPASGVTTPGIVEKVTARAISYAVDSMLTRVTPQFVTRHEVGGNIFHSCSDWRFAFHSRQRHCTFYLRSLDPTWIDEADVEQNDDDLGASFLLTLIDQCRLDCRDAYLIGRLAGASPDPESLALDLECEIVDGYPRPVWRLPLSLNERPVSVRADSGELLVLTNGLWRPDRPASVKG